MLTLTDSVTSMAARWHQRLRRFLPGWLNSPDAYLACVVTLIGAVVALRWIAELIVNSGRGLDASDEAYYLLAVQFPHASKAAASGFDSFLAPVWWSSGKSIARFRVAGLLMLLGAIAAVTRMCGRTFAVVTGWSALAIAAFAASGVAAVALTFYTLWLPTPGYNLVVVVVALLVAGLTTCLAVTPVVLPSYVEPKQPWFPLDGALGFALSIGLVVKAPAFASIGTLSCAALVIVRGPVWFARRLWRFAAGFVAGLLVFVALTGSPVSILHRFSRGLHAAGLLGSHTSETLWETEAVRHVYGPWFLKYLAGALLIGVLWRFIRRDEVRLLITAIGSMLTAVVFARGLPGGGTAAFGDNAGWWWVRLAAMTMLWLTANAGIVSRKLVLGPLVSLMAVGAAAGSGNGFILEVALTAGVLGVGVVVHGLVVASSRNAMPSVEPAWSRRPAVVLLPVALFFVVGSLASGKALNDALISPYRLNGPLDAEAVPVNLGSFGTVDVHPETARYIRELQTIGKQVPADARDCLVDLAGGTPLAAIALGEKPAASTWIVGGYAGSNDFADYVLHDAPCLSGPYVLIEATSGLRPLDRPKWLDTTGAKLLGRVRYSGYMIEDQLVWLVPGVKGG